MIERDAAYMPIVVRTGKRRTPLSLQRFAHHYGERCAEPLVLHAGDIACQDGIAYLPYYMAGLL